ncbi:MAG: hypothetical protein WCK70_19580, partial [Chloroflexales bacterium]
MPFTPSRRAHYGSLALLVLALLLSMLAALPSSAPRAHAATGTGIVRYEENDPAMRFNGQPVATVPASWIFSASNTISSGGSAAVSKTANDEASLSFTGTWVSIGLVTGSDQGQAEVFIDGVSRGVVDSYSNGTSPSGGSSGYSDVASSVYSGLAAGSHTIVLRVLGTKNAFSIGTSVQLDYIDVWDGTPMATGSFDETDPRFIKGSGWSA